MPKVILRIGMFITMILNELIRMSKNLNYFLIIEEKQGKQPLGSK